MQNKGVYLALDFPTGKEALAFLENNELQGVPVKVGMELFYKEGTAIVEKLKNNGHAIFLDLKLHDIPNTVGSAMRNLAGLNVDLVNVHVFGGEKMIQQAKEGLKAGASQSTPPKLLAVTILTSMDNDTLQEGLHVNGEIDELVPYYASYAMDNGADGVVCSAHEVEAIKKACGSEFLTITPGIRLKDNDANDQHRVATPSFARRKGSDMMVIGRTVTKAENPKLAYEEVLKEWENGIA